jgi:acyl-CoA thioesterase I
MGENIRMRARIIGSILLASALLVSACGEVASRNDTSRILAIGDSMLAWHRGSGTSVSGALERRINERVTDRSVIGARFNYALPITGAMGLNISKQYVSGTWDWVIINGGGNDLLFGCGCVACDYTIDKLISADGRNGKIPALVRKARSTNARVILVGYLHSPGVPSLVDGCKDDDNELQRRISKIPALDDGVYYVRASDIVGSGDTSYHAGDRIHPSAKGSAEIARQIASIIKNY